MHVAIMGTGYVGLVAGAGLADLGMTVTCVDIDQQKIRSLEQGTVPIFEPGLAELVRRNIQRSRLHFSSNIETALKTSLAIFVAVGSGAAPLGDCPPWRKLCA